MKRLILLLFVISCLPKSVLASEDGSSQSTTLQIDGGKLIREKHEIEIYDYHSGTLQTVDVYRQLPKSEKSAAEKAEKPQLNEPAAR